MLFLVSGEWVEPGALLPAEQLPPILEQVVLPSLEMLAGWEEQGKVHGGVFAGERAGAWVVEAASGEEIGQLLTSLPFWGLVKWQVRPLQSARSTAERDRRVAEQIKAMVGR
jgi:hypothetical protein